MPVTRTILTLTAALLACTSAPTQQPPELRPRPAPTTPTIPKPGLRGFTEPDEPATPTPAALDFHDPKYKLDLHIPAGWNFERHDGLLSNFGRETRSTHRRMDLRGVAAINFNPWPVSTFSGALFYYSVVPRSTPEACAAQTSTRAVKPLPPTEIAGLPFHHGRDRHGVACTEARDEVFTTLRNRTCLRFDLVINTFCAETSGAREITPAQLDDVEQRLAGILSTIHLEGIPEATRPTF